MEGRSPVFQHLREQERILEILEAAAVGRVHVVDLGVPGPDVAGRVDRLEGVPCPLRRKKCQRIDGKLSGLSVIKLTHVLVLAVARRAVGVVEALHHLWSEDVHTVDDVVTRSVVEVPLVVRYIR